MTTNYKLLIELKEDHYHILPSPEECEDSGICQEDNMAGFGVGIAEGLRVKNFPQKDGSRFKTIKGKPTLGRHDVLWRLSESRAWSERWGSQYELWGETSASEIERINQDDWKYVLYRTHIFLNAWRVIPLLINAKLKTAMHVSSLFPEKTPEDDLGILIGGIRELNEVTVEGKEPEGMVDYLSHIRLCPTCGIVSDMAKARRHPWASKAAKLGLRR